MAKALTLETWSGQCCRRRGFPPHPLLADRPTLMMIGRPQTQGRNSVSHHLRIREPCRTIMHHHRQPLRRKTPPSFRVRMSAVELQPSIALKRKAAEVSDALKGTSLFLTGMNCTMKTNIAKVLADALRYYYFDSDSLVLQAAEGELDAESFRKRDENGFRESETEVLKQLSSMGRLVVCAGDGAVQGVTNLAYLRYGISLWVNVPLNLMVNEMLKSGGSEQVAKKQTIPTTDKFLEVHELTKRYEELKEGYTTADATISLQSLASVLGYDDLEMVTPEDMSLEVLNQIEKLTRVKKMMEEAAKPF